MIAVDGGSSWQVGAGIETIARERQSLRVFPEFSTRLFTESRKPATLGL